MQYLSGTANKAVASPTRTAATCYIAINSFETGEPPCNVCDVASNDFHFEDENLLFQIIPNYK